MDFLSQEFTVVEQSVLDDESILTSILNGDKEEEKKSEVSVKSIKVQKSHLVKIDPER